MTDWREEIGHRVWLAQVVVGALVVGCLVFLGIAVLLVRLGGMPAANDSMIVTWLAVLVALVAVGARLVLPSFIVASNRQAILHKTGSLAQPSSRNASVAEFLERTGDAGRLWLGYLAKTILGSAIFEGVAFFCLIAYLVEHSPLSLGLAVLFLIGLACQFPTRAGVVRWIQGQLDLLAQLRQLD
jgi:hypothetical protein